MKTLSNQLKARYVGRRSSVLLLELGDACQQILKVLAQLEMPGLNEKQVDELLGELSALIVHLHEHTRGLSDLIDKDAR